MNFIKIVNYFNKVVRCVKEASFWIERWGVTFFGQNFLKLEIQFYALRERERKK